MQRQTGVENDARRVGRIISATIPPAVSHFVRWQRLAVFGSLDEGGWPWASLVTGASGFIRAIDQHLVRIDATPCAGDPLETNLRERPELGLLVIDLATRQRVRLNGTGTLTADRGIVLRAEEVYGNCPKYIQTRLAMDGPPPSAEAAASTRFDALQPRHQEWIARADTFFIASYHPEGGADVSHRGGQPAFVTVLSERALLFPDYPGNNMFNTLGNIAGYPKAGLLFVDFERGDVLQLTGRASLLWAPRPPRPARGVEHAAVQLAIDGVVEIRGSSGVRWRLVELSPSTP